MTEKNAQLTDKVQRQEEDIDLLNAKFVEFTEKLGKHYDNFIYLIFFSL